MEPRIFGLNILYSIEFIYIFFRQREWQHVDRRIKNEKKIKRTEKSHAQATFIGIRSVYGILLFAVVAFICTTFQLKF